MSDGETTSGGTRGRGSFGSQWPCTLQRLSRPRAATALEVAGELKLDGRLPGIQSLEIVSSRTPDGGWKEHLIGSTGAGPAWFFQARAGGEPELAESLLAEFKEFAARVNLARAHFLEPLDHIQHALNGDTPDEPRLVHFGLRIDRRFGSASPAMLFLIDAIGRDGRRSLQRIDVPHPHLKPQLASILRRHVKGLAAAKGFGKNSWIAALDKTAVGVMEACGIEPRDVLQTLDGQRDAWFRSDRCGLQGRFSFHEFRVVASLKHPSFTLGGNALNFRQAPPMTLLQAAAGRPLGELIDMPILPKDIIIERAELDGAGGFRLHLRRDTVLVDADHRLLMAPP